MDVVEMQRDDEEGGYRNGKCEMGKKCQVTPTLFSPVLLSCQELHTALANDAPAFAKMPVVDYVNLLGGREALALLSRLYLPIRTVAHWRG
jgi:hypothetical protein